MVHDIYYILRRRLANLINLVNFIDGIDERVINNKNKITGEVA